MDSNRRTGIGTEIGTETQTGTGSNIVVIQLYMFMSEKLGMFIWTRTNGCNFRCTMEMHNEYNFRCTMEMHNEYNFRCTMGTISGAQ